MIKKSELLKSPKRKWDDTSKEYDCLLIVPTRRKHESGWALIAVIGANYKDGELCDFEICATPDDIITRFPMQDIGLNKPYPLVRMDCFYPGGVLRYHGKGKFRVGPALSSVELHFTPSF